MDTINASGNNPYAVDNKVASKNVPYLFTSIHDINKPCFGANNTDLKRDYINRQQTSSQMFSASIPTNWN